MEIRDRALDPATRLVVLKGVLDNATAPLFEERIKRLLADGAQYFIVDVTAVEAISSAGLRALVGSAQETAMRRGKLVLHSPTSAVQEALDLSGLSSLFSIYGSREAAVAAMASTTSRV